jgi:hypothetical protein
MVLWRKPGRHKTFAGHIVWLAEIRGIGVRDGCFCAHRLIKFLFGIQAKNMGEFVKRARPGLVRVSLGLENTADEVDAFLGTLAGIIDDPANKRFTLNDDGCKYSAGRLDASRSITRKIDEFVQGIVRDVYATDPAKLMKGAQG